MKTRTKIMLLIVLLIVLILGYLVSQFFLATSAAKPEEDHASVIDEIVKEYESVDQNKDNGLIYVNNEIVVVAQKGVTVEEMRKLAEDNDAQLDDSMSDINFYRFVFSYNLSYRQLAGLVEDLKEDARVKNAYLNTVIDNDSDDIYDDFERASEVTPNDPWEYNDWKVTVPRDSNWGMEAIDAPGAWGYLDRMSEVNVGLIDCYPNKDHPDLTLQNWTIWLRSDWDASVKKSSTYYTSGDHGSHVSGTICADWDNNTGVSGVMGDKGKLYYSMLYNEKNSGEVYADYLTAFDYLKCLKTLIEQDVRAINISQNTSRLIGFAASRGNRNAISHLKYNADIASEGLEAIIEQRNEEGKPDFVICVAAGNSNNTEYYKDDGEIYGYRENKTFGEWFISIFGWRGEIGESQAKYNNFLSLIDNETVKDRIIVVGSIGIDNRKSTSANTAYHYSNFSNVGDRVDVVAPGEHIYSCYYDGYDYMDGTSMATPHVTGVAGLIFASNPDLKGPEVKSIIKASTTQRFYFSGGDAGLINANIAVIKALLTKEKSVKRVVGTANKGLDLCFVVDTTGSMGDDIDDAKANMEVILTQLAEKTSDYRVALIDYRDFSSRTRDSRDYPSKIQLEFSADDTEIRNAIMNLSLGDGGDTPETVYSALMSALTLDWRDEAKKVIVVLGDAKPLDPEPNTGYTYQQVLFALFDSKIAIDYEDSDKRVLDGEDSWINVYTIGTEDSADASAFFKEISHDTGGGYSSVSDASQVSDAIVNTIEQIEMVELISTKFSFGDSLSNSEIDLYYNDKFVTSFVTDEKGDYRIDNLDPMNYTWVSVDSFTKGSMRLSEGSKKARLSYEDEYFITKIYNIWKGNEIAVLVVLYSLFAFFTLLPDICKVFIKKKPVKTVTEPIPDEIQSKKSDMETCKYCGSIFTRIGKFCPNCGKPFEE